MKYGQVVVVIAVLALAGVLVEPILSGEKDPRIGKVPEGPLGGAGKLKIGVVNLFAVFQNYHKSVKFEEQIKIEAKKTEAEFKKENEEIEELQHEVKAIQPGNKKYREKTRELAQRKALYKVNYEAAMSSLEDQTEAATHRLLQEIYREIEDYGKARGYTVIFKTDTGEVSKNFMEMRAQVSRRSVLYYVDAVDLTGEITASLNRTEKEEK